MLQAASSTLQKQLSIYVPYVNNMQMFWSTSLSDHHGFSMARTPRTSSDRSSSRKVGVSFKLSQNLYLFAAFSPESPLQLMTRICLFLNGWEPQQVPSFYELKQNGVIYSCICLGFFAACNSLSAWLSSFGILLTDGLRNLPDCLNQCICNCLQMGLVEMIKQCIQKLQLWTQWETELCQDERILHQSLHGKVSHVLAGKRLLFLEKLANSIGWPDTNLHRELREGFKLTGYAAPTGVFKTELRPAPFDKQQLMQDAKFIKPLLLGKVTS